MKMKIIIAIVIIVIVISGFFYFNQQKPDLVLNERQSLMLSYAMKDQVPPLTASTPEELLVLQEDFMNIWKQVGGTEQELIQKIREAQTNNTEINIWRELKAKIESR